MKEDSGYFYSVEPVVDIDHFVELLLACLANGTYPIVYIPKKKEKKSADLPVNYLTCIEKILTEQEFGYYFAELIDFRTYYEHQLAWEDKFKKAISDYLKRNNKELKFNLEKNIIQVEFTKEEIEETLASYDQISIEKMERFCRLITHYGNHHQAMLERKESERLIKRRYIRSSASTFSKTWDD